MKSLLITDFCYGLLVCHHIVSSWQVLTSEGHVLSQELAFRLLWVPHPNPNLNSLALHPADFRTRNEIIVKSELINMTRAWNKEKIWVPDRNQTHDHEFSNTRRALSPLSYENSRRASSFNWVHVWQIVISIIKYGNTHVHPQVHFG